MHKIYIKYIVNTDLVDTVFEFDTIYETKKYVFFVENGPHSFTYNKMYVILKVGAFKDKYWLPSDGARRTSNRTTSNMLLVELSNPAQ